MGGRSYPQQGIMSAYQLMAHNHSGIGQGGFVSHLVLTNRPKFDVRNWATFADAITAIGATETTLFIPTVCAVTGNVTVPNSLTLEVQHGGGLNISNGIVVTIDGHIEAGLFQIFTGLGTVVIDGEASFEYPTLWWGAGSPAINSAIQAVPLGSVVRLSRYEYIEDTILIDRKIILQGYGVVNVPSIPPDNQGATCLLKADTLNAPGILITTYRADLRDFYLDGEAGNGGNGIFINRGRCKLESIGVFNQGQDGIRVGLDGAGNCNFFHFDRVFTMNNTRHGLHLHSNGGGSPDANAGVIVGLNSDNNGGDGVYINNSYLNTFIGLLVANNTGWGINLTAEAEMQRFFGTDFEANGLGVLQDLGLNTQIFPDLYGKTRTDGIVIGVPTELTIAAGAITVIKSYHRIDGEGDANDDLDTINGGVDGMFLTIMAEAIGRTITVRDGIGNIHLEAGNMVLDTPPKKLFLFYDSTFGAGSWVEKSRFNG